VEAVAAIEDRVRDQVRARGIDPLRDPSAVRALIADEMARLDPDDNSAAEARHAFHAIAGFGPLQPYLDDPDVEELWINAPGRVFVARGGRSELTTVVLDSGEVRDLVERMLRVSGRRLDLSSPFVDAMLPDGSRLHVAIPDVTREHWAVNIRRFVVRPRTLRDLVALGMLTQEAAAFLDACVVSGLNIVVAGGTQSGKTTFLNALLGSVEPSERVITCEEVFELRLDHPDVVGLQTRDAGLEGLGEIPLRRLVREALRMRPTRLVVGEVRQGEALDLLVAMNSGMPAMATLHANSAREAVTKLCTLPLLAGPNIDASFVLPTVAGCVDIVVHLAADSGGRRVREIVALPGRVEAGVVETADVFSHDGTSLVPRGGYPPHEDRFVRHGYHLPTLLGTQQRGSARPGSLVGSPR
jgi:pilus assembly protein CpaF